MNVEEMRERLKDHCDAQKGCRECPLEPIAFEDCAFEDYPDEGIEDYYNIVFGDEKEEINHPDRYAGGKFECIDVMLDVFGADAVKHFCILNAFKYLWRAEKKNGVEDIEKAVWYLNKYIELGGDKNDR